MNDKIIINTEGTQTIFRPYELVEEESSILKERCVEFDFSGNEDRKSTRLNSSH